MKLNICTVTGSGEVQASPVLGGYVQFQGKDVAQGHGQSDGSSTSTSSLPAPPHPQSWRLPRALAPWCREALGSEGKETAEPSHLPEVSASPWQAPLAGGSSSAMRALAWERVELLGGFLVAMQAAGMWSGGLAPSPRLEPSGARTVQKGEWPASERPHSEGCLLSQGRSANP